MTSTKSAAVSWSNRTSIEIPAAEGCAALLDELDTTVPSRTGRRTAAHREAYCVIGALRWPTFNRPEMFPATLLRIEAPDFIVLPQSQARPLALEHTDAGEQEFQQWLARTEDEEGAIALPSPDDEGWLGDAPEHAFDEAICLAVTRKSESKFWRNAPEKAVRCVLAYDQTNAGTFVSDARALQSIQRAAATAPGFGVLLVRSSQRVLVAGFEP